MKHLIHAGQLQALADALDASTHAQRVAFVHGLGRRDQRALWALAAGSEPLTLADLVPEAVPHGGEVRHHGHNTLLLPAWGRRFCKTMARGPAPEVFGYNASPFQTVIGPGFYVARRCRPDEHPASTVVVDYHLRPAGGAPSGWPSIRPNWLGLQVLVYFHTRDYLRRVSKHVTIGLATKYGWSIGSWFALTREDPEPTP